jgi:hypothetical protein
MVQLSERNKVLKDFCVTEAELKRMKALGHREASWRLKHETTVQIDWVQRRHIFIQAELDLLLPPKPKRTREPDEGPVVSHRSGRPNSAGLSQFGERYG